MEVLAKPGALTDEEFELMKQHTVWGEELLAGSPLLRTRGALRALAPRAHGWPRLPRWSRWIGDPRREVTIISVCDAWDAMTFNRPYRSGMDHEAALAILREGAGSQWRADAVGLLEDELAANGPVVIPVYDRVGRGEGAASTDDGMVTEVCLDALPHGARPRVSPL